MTRTVVSEPQPDRASATVRRLGPPDWRDLRSARLAALVDAPDAFVATPADEVARTRKDWIAGIRLTVWAGAWVEGQIVGIACLSAAEPIEPTRPFVESVWVAPEYRGRGIVEDMLSVLEDAARRKGATHLQLWVLETNRRASTAYLNLDFVPVPARAQDSKKLSDDDKPVKEHLMVRSL